MQTLSLTQTRSRHRRIAITLLWALTIQWVLPLGVVAKAPNSDTPVARTRNHATPAAAPFETQSEFIRQIPLVANDVVYSPVTGKLYASVPSSAESGGNSIATINPVTGAITNLVFIGSEPNELALSDDGHTLYVALDGAFAVRRFDVISQTAGLQFSVGSDDPHGPYSIRDLAVAPGNPNLVAVARYYRGVSPPEAGVAVYENGIQRTQTGPSHSVGNDYLAFSASASKLYGTGLYSGLTTMTVDASGITVAGAVSLSAGHRIKFDNGRIYGGSGQVINPDSGTLLGTFSAATTSGFVPDSAVGRAYYLVTEQANRTLKAYDINNFLPVGSATIPGVVGDATAMVRWGSNGLAFRTSGNQLFILQTSLIPSADPVPTATPTPSPTATPTPTPVSTFVRQLSLVTNDLVFNPTTQTLHVSVPGTGGGSLGNSITSIDPVPGTVVNSTFIGSEPNKLALSSDGQTLWVGLNGAGSVRRFETVSRTPGQQFSLGIDSYDGPRQASNMAVMPGSPGTVAIHRSSSSSTIALYDDGVPRAQTIFNTGPLKFGSGSTLFVLSGGVRKVAVSSSGLTLVNNTYTNFSGNAIEYANGLSYINTGMVVDPETQTIKGYFGGLGFDSLGYNAAMTVDAASGRVYFVAQVNNTWVLRAFDINTFVPLGATTITGVIGNPTSLSRWGTNGLAFRTATQVFMIQTSLVSSADPIPAATPTPSPTPSPSPAYIPTFVRRLDLPANDLAYSQVTSSLYASVPSLAGPNGNSITRIVPSTGAISSSVFIGSEPGRMAISRDGQTLWAYLNGAAAFRRFEVATEAPGAQFSSSTAPVDMEIVPGSPNSLAVSRGVNSFDSQVVIFDNGVARTKASSGSFYGIGPIEFGASAATLYGYDSFSSAFELVKFSVDATGLTTASVTNNLLTGYVNGFEFHNGLLYGGAGRVVDPEAKQLAGTFPGVGFGNLVTVDETNGRAFYLASNGSSPVLAAFDINTFLPLGSITLNNIVGQPVRLVRWGTNGLAFNTVTQYSTDPNLSRVYVLQSALVSAGGTIPTGVQFSLDNFSAYEAAPTVMVAVTRSGDVSGSTSVNYATSDGTAVAGSDYTATNGTVTFNPGETTKNITIAMLDDSVYEGPPETFNVTLSSPTGGAILGTPATARVTINDSEGAPSVGVFNVSVLEGNSGTTNANFAVNLSNPSAQTVTVDYSTAGNTAASGDDFVAKTGTVTFEPGSTSKTVSVLVNGDSVVEPDETFFLNLSNATNVSYTGPNQGLATILDDDGPPKIGFAVTSLQVSEGVRLATIFVSRTGRNTGTSSVNYATQDGTARQTTDYTVANGTLVFSPGQTSRSVKVLINDDGYPESTESLTVNLSNASGDGATLGNVTTAALFILNNDFDSLLPNPIDNAEFFVRAHYSDFLGRSPDDEGLAYWSSQITQCGSDPICTHEHRVAVSNAFFFEPEYQQTASYVFLLYRAAYGNDQPSFNPDTSNVPEAKKLPRYSTFVRDRAQVVGGSNLAQAQLALATDFVQRPEFLAKYPLSLATGPEFVDAVLATIQAGDGAVLSNPDRNTLVAHFNNAGRPLVMFHLANDYFNGCDRLPGSPAAPCVPAGFGTAVDNRPFIDAEYNRSFVYSQYTGYLRRDADIGGFLFWLNEVNKGAPRNAALQHAMVCSFITSTEYQRRFSFLVSHSNADCPG
jgi:hypothetical protein